MHEPKLRELVFPAWRKKESGENLGEPSGAPPLRRFAATPGFIALRSKLEHKKEGGDRVVNRNQRCATGSKSIRLSSSIVRNAECLSVFELECFSISQPPERPLKSTSISARRAGIFCLDLSFHKRVMSPTKADFRYFCNLLAHKQLRYNPLRAMSLRRPTCTTCTVHILHVRACYARPIAGILTGMETEIKPKCRECSKCT